MADLASLGKLRSTLADETGTVRPIRKNSIRPGNALGIAYSWQRTCSKFATWFCGLAFFNMLNATTDWPWSLPSVHVNPEISKGHWHW